MKTGQNNRRRRCEEECGDLSRALRLETARQRINEPGSSGVRGNLDQAKNVGKLEPDSSSEPVGTNGHGHGKGRVVEIWHEVVRTGDTFAFGKVRPDHKK